MALARILRDRGHAVFSITLTGVGDRAHLLSPMLSAKSMGVADTDASAVDAKLTPHPMATLEDKVQFDEAAIAALPKTFIWCGAYAGFKPWAEKAAAWGWRVITLDAGHDVMLSAPEALANALK